MHLRSILIVLCGLLSSTANAHTYYSLNTAKETLGQGFEQTLGIPLEPCLDGQWQFQGGSMGDLVYRGDFDSDTMINTITGSVKAGINLVIFGGSAKFSMRRKVTKNRNSAASAVELTYEKGSYNFENRTTKPNISDLLNTSPSEVRGRCGDSFIHNIKLGSRIYVTAKLHFADQTKYEWFQTKIKVKFLFFSKTFTKTKVFQDATKDAVYTIQVNTDGGMTPELARLTKNGTMHCKTDNLTPCITYADNLFSYLLDGGDYVDDLKDEHLNVLKYEVESYEDSGHYDLAYAGQPAISERYIALSARLRGYQDLVYDEIERLTAFRAVSEDPSEIAQLNTRLQARENQRISLEQAGEYCATLPGTTLCENRVESAIATVD
ncbi:hypothetical protein HUZ36_03915 [Pseudoalteromonas sp. McH1-7]|uniref:hypothetical protein n=1 Tax=Pseudoalteromonas sp. McH1-7 TaxID=2745574 RepID=UPI001591D359|nr:hypothetical protein [Pseudoalteromonas sp. McH1-7]NUZ09917.1 hypothetical protein [Pseudoalteromonas sp. McH1-7]